MPGPNIGKMMKQIQNMQKQVQDMQEELKTKTVEATAGGGAVTVIASGDEQIQEVRIKPDVVDPEDVEMLEDLILVAVNEALRKAKELAASELQKIAGGLGLPGLPQI